MRLGALVWLKIKCSISAQKEDTVRICDQEQSTLRPRCVLVGVGGALWGWAVSSTGAAYGP